jgi:predicted metalloprotease with PDZ domain
VRVRRLQIEPGELVRAPRGYLGVELLPLTRELRAHFGAPADAGALVARVEAGSPADKAGIRVGDVLTRIDGEEVAGPHDVRAQIRDAEDGQAAAVEVYRDGRPQTLTATLERRERSELDLAPFFIRDGGPGKGMVLRLDPEKLGERLEEIEIAAGDPPRLLGLRRREAELEKRLAELEKRIQELEKRLQK